MNSVLVTVVNGMKVIDGGSGVVFHQDTGISYVLTCAHNLRGVKKPQVSGDPQLTLWVNGNPAHEVVDISLGAYDLAVLKVESIISKPMTLLAPSQPIKELRAEGFVSFFGPEFAHIEIQGKLEKRIAALSQDGTLLSYLTISPQDGSDGFKKGMSGGPIFNKEDMVIAIARISERTEQEKSICHAIELTSQIISLINEKIPLAANQSSEVNDRPPPAPPPLSESIENDDIQKNRWGRSSSGHGASLEIANVAMHLRYFEFDAVLKADEGVSLNGPFIFHLHDTFPKSVIWVRKFAKGKAVLNEISADGTFTLGVQFRDSSGKWVSLEYDLADHEEGVLKKYD